jgi:hypothetical protein
MRRGFLRLRSSSPGRRPLRASPRRPNRARGRRCNPNSTLRSKKPWEASASAGALSLGGDTWGYAPAAALFNSFARVLNVTASFH